MFEKWKRWEDIMSIMHQKCLDEYSKSSLISNPLPSYKTFTSGSYRITVIDRGQEVIPFSLDLNSSGDPDLPSSISWGNQRDHHNRAITGKLWIGNYEVGLSGVKSWFSYTVGQGEAYIEGSKDPENLTFIVGKEQVTFWQLYERASASSKEVLIRDWFPYGE